jgi:hypothetical protein
VNECNVFEIRRTLTEKLPHLYSLGTLLVVRWDAARAAGDGRGGAGRTGCRSNGQALASDAAASSARPKLGVPPGRNLAV